MGKIKKLTSKLSDGRDIFYFDDEDSSLSEDRKPDQREPIARPAIAQMRQDILTGEWISIAAARQNRVFLPSKEQDPLAPQTSENPSEVPDNYDVVVFENKSPSFSPIFDDENAPKSLEDLSELGLNRTRSSVGKCEVVCFSPEHEGSFANLSRSRARTVIEAWADRTRELSKCSGIEQVFPFENRGEEIGVTLHHPHGQIYAYPYITPKTSNLIRSIETYGSDLFQDILDNEKASNRIVLEGKFWTAFVPFAARWPIEIHMLPSRHVPDFAELNEDEKDELATLYLRLLRGVDSVYDSPTPYIAAWHQAPVNVHRNDIRLMLQVTSPRRDVNKLKYLAGSEAAMGAWIGDITPEDTATKIREAISKADKSWPV